MHIVTRRSKNGLIKTLPHIGTNNVESFLKYYNNLVWSFRSGPLLAHSVVVPFIARWNVRMADDGLGCVGKSATSALTHTERALLAWDRSLLVDTQGCFTGPRLALAFQNLLLTSQCTLRMPRAGCSRS